MGSNPINSSKVAVNKLAAFFVLLYYHSDSYTKQILIIQDIVIQCKILIFGNTKEDFVKKRVIFETKHSDFNPMFDKMFDKFA